MIRTVVTAAVAAVLVLAAHDARAWAPDQAQTCAAKSWNVGVYQPIGQTFTPGQPELDAASFFLANYGDAADVTVDVRVDPDTPPIASRTINVPPDIDGNWYSFQLDTPLAVTPGSTYVLQLSTGGVNVLVGSGDCGYAGGAAFGGGGFDAADLAFQTFGPCGNGVIDGDEQCDDGNTQNGDCCSSACTFDDAATSCTDEGDLCTTDVCDGAGTCQHLAVARTTCATSGATLAVTDDPDVDAKDKLTFVWKKGTAALADFGAPADTTAYALCIYGAGTVLHGEQLQHVLTWQPTKSGLQYKRKDGFFAGVTQVDLKAGVAGKAAVKWTSKGENVPDFAATPWPNDFTVEVVTSDAACWRADFTAPKKNAGGKIKAKSDGAPPAVE
jgi:cysteine-rich repeat protein